MRQGREEAKEETGKVEAVDRKKMEQRRCKKKERSRERLGTIVNGKGRRKQF